MAPAIDSNSIRVTATPDAAPKAVEPLLVKVVTG